MSDPAAGAIARPARAAVDRSLTWDLEGLFPSTTAWEEAAAKADNLALEAVAWRGRLARGAAALQEYLRFSERLEQIAHQVYWFAQNRLAEDQAAPARQALADRATALSARVQAATAFFEPELLALPEGTVEAYLEAGDGLAVYRLFLQDVLAKPHH